MTAMASHEVDALMAGGTEALIEALRQETAARQKAEEALWRSEQKWGAYFQLRGIGVGVVAVDKTWLEANDTLCAMLGYPREELLKLTWLAVTHPDDRAPSTARHGHMIAKGVAEGEFQKRYVRKDGGVVEAKVYKHALHHPNGEVEGWVLFVFDITSLMETQRKLQSSDAELRERLRTIEEQKRAIETLSAPILRVWPGVLAMPIVGGLDAARAARVTERLLARIVETRGRYAILDLTGVEAVDAVAAGHLAGLFYTVKLIGARPIVTGIQPGVAQAMTALGVSLDGVLVRATMQQALELCMRAA